MTGLCGEGGEITLRERFMAEFRHFLTLFVYLWLLFGLFVLNQDIVRREEDGTPLGQGFAILNALVLGKVMLVAEHLDFARWLRGKPTIWSIVMESVLCTAFFIAFHSAERLIAGWLHGTSAGKGLIAIGGGGLSGLTIVATILFVSLLPFFAFKNVTRVIGWPNMRKILFGNPERSGAADGDRR